MDTANLRLTFSKGASVTWSDPAIPPVFLQITGRIREPVEIVPHYVLIEAFPGQRHTATLTITNPEPEPLRITRVHSDRPDVQARLEAIEPGKKYNLVVSRDPKLPPGGYQGALELVLEGSTGPNPRIPVTLVQKKRVYVTRAAVMFRNRPPDGALDSVTLMVEKYQDPKFTVTNLASNLPFVKAEAVRLPYQQDVARYELRVTVPAELRPADSFSGSLTFETNDEESPRFTLPVRGPGRSRELAGAARIQ